MTKIKLEMVYDYDFDLIGISCHAPDYRLCWAINQSLGIRLGKKEEDISLRSKKLGDVHHSIYEYFSDEDHVEYFLLMNRNGASYLVPEQKAADYFLILRNNFAIDINELNGRLKGIDMIQTAFSIDAESLKSRDNLLL